MSKKDHTYSCNICNKEYSTYNTLWVHNKKFHSINPIKKQSFDNHSPIKNNHLQNNGCDTTKQCKFCNKVFSHYNNKWRHEKSCKNDKIIELKLENNKLKKELEIKNNIKTINKNNYNNTTNNNQINNGIINNTNNIIINQIGYESVEDMQLNNILKILDSGNNMPINCIKNLNFNKDLPENHSFCATTLEGKSQNNFYKLF
jgi:hypothetical protein